jgi:hypothetical protein
MPHPDQYGEARAPKLMTARTTTAPATASDRLMVSIPSYGADMPPFGPCVWSPRGTQMPPLGVLCLVALDENGIPWVIQWRGSWA